MSREEETTTSQSSSKAKPEAIRILDLHFWREGTIAAFLLRSSDGPVLIETGPDSTYPALVRALREAGTTPEAVRHVLLTHIHLDHAGAAWRLAAHGATVYVHPVGAPHLADPSKLLASARKIYGDQMDSLWGRLEPIAAGQLRTVTDGEVLRIGDLAIEALHTPGHASHHIAYRVDGAVLTGDVGGVRILGGPAVPPCPPPDIDVEAWRASLARLRAIGAQRFYLTHFGVVHDTTRHLDQLERGLTAFASFIRAQAHEGLDDALIVPRFEAFTQGFLTASGADEASVQRYAIANPAFMSVAGLTRYWRKRERDAVPGSRA
ncbi:MAG: MBL fold metallo-hydrolase [Thermoanaerobaculales bacterium]